MQSAVHPVVTLAILVGELLIQAVFGLLCGRSTVPPIDRVGTPYPLIWRLGVVVDPG